MGIIHEIGAGPVFLDTPIFIYFIEENVHYIELVEPLFNAIDNGRLVAITSGITLLETLVVPLRRDDLQLASQYEQLLCASKGLTLLTLDRELLRKGASLRAKFNLKTPDALQMAAALLKNCSTFVTHDRRLPNIPGLKVLQLSDYKT